MEVGMIRRVDIDHEMQASYLDYAMSVIVSRALPDARDGLKPVQRRILYAMYDMGLRADSPYKKSARVVGEVLGKYHPHGDMAVYEAMARLAQNFSMRYPLVDGQGNFGSIDGDPPAAQRYTEARLMPFAMEMLNQIDRDTVDFGPNFDDTLKEPLVLPAAVPNLLVNGGSGIAVGMATSIPPHNLGEVTDALIYMLNDWDRLDDITISDLMRFIQGPDFPTGGIILQENGQSDLQAAYASGRGRVTVRGRVHEEEMGRGRSRLIITELPYQTNKSSLIERIAELVREGDLEGIADLRDESDRRGMRIVIELNKAAESDHILRSLYQRTPLQSTFSIALLALVDNEPRMLTLKQALKVYVEHRLDVVKRRTKFDLERARQRAHILEGLRIAINNLDEIIALIRAAPDADQAKVRLMKRFKLTEVQAQAILDMPLRRLAALERKKIEQEYKELQKLISELESLLRSPKKMRQVVIDELLQMREKYGDRRRTQIVSLAEGQTSKALLTANELTPAHNVWIAVTRSGRLSRTESDRLPVWSGQNVPVWLIRANTHHTLYLVSSEGRTAAVSVENLPKSSELGQGAEFHKVSPLEEHDQLAALFSLPSSDKVQENQFVITVTRSGLIKKSALTELPGPSAQAFTLVKVNEGDALKRVFITGGESDLVLITAAGMSIRFSELEVRPMGLVAAGVNGIKLKNGDLVVGAEPAVEKTEVVVAAVNGKGWRIPVKELPVQGRYGQGTLTCKLAKGTQIIGTVSGNPDNLALIHFEKGDARQIQFKEVGLAKRGGAGKDFPGAKEGGQVLGLTPLVDGMEMFGGNKFTLLPPGPDGSSSNGNASGAAKRGSGLSAKTGKSTSVTSNGSAKTKPAAASEVKTTRASGKGTTGGSAASKKAKPAVPPSASARSKNSSGAKAAESQQPAAVPTPARGKKIVNTEQPAAKARASKGVASENTHMAASPLEKPSRTPSTRQSAGRQADSTLPAKEQPERKAPAPSRPSRKSPAPQSPAVKPAPAPKTPARKPATKKSPESDKTGVPKAQSEPKPASKPARKQKS